jgi:hypothetical protein
MGDGGVPTGTATKAPPSIPEIPPAPMRTEEQPEISLPTTPFLAAPSRAPTPSVRKKDVEAPPTPGVVSTPSSKATPKISQELEQGRARKEEPIPAQLRRAEVLAPVTSVPTRAPGPAATAATVAATPLAPQPPTQRNEGLRLPAPVVPPIALATPPPSTVSPLPGLDIAPLPAPQIPAAAPGLSEAAAAVAVTETPLVAKRAMPPPGSPFGLGPGFLRVAFDGPQATVTGEPTVSVSGRIQGGAAIALVLLVNESAQEVSIDRRSFNASVTLTAGPNRIMAVVSGPDGLEAEDTITIEYAPKLRPAESRSSPVDGLALGPDDAPAVLSRWPGGGPGGEDGVARRQRASDGGARARWLVPPRGARPEPLLRLRPRVAPRTAHRIGAPPSPSARRISVASVCSFWTGWAALQAPRWR